MPPKPKYTHLSQRNQILKRPAQHIGSTKNVTKEVWTAITEYTDGEEVDRILQQNLTINPGLIHIFYEVLGNAQDNYFKSHGGDTPLKKIQVDIDIESGRISVWNDGNYIPANIHEWDEDEEVIDDEQHYEAEIIFGNLNSSSNYNDDEEARVGGGLHGVGVKLTNIFSKEFRVEAFDPEQQLKFDCTWSENMSKMKKPKVTTLKQKKGFTKVSYVADFSKFGVEGYTDSHISVMRKLCVDCAMITGQQVIFNGEKIPVKSLLAYAEQYTDGEKIEFKTSDTHVVLAEKPAFEAGFTQVSFVNGINTAIGGVHVDAWKSGIFKPLLEKIRNKYSKGKNSTPIKITPKNLEQYFMLFINCNLKNPDFEGQTKGILASPTPKTQISDAKINKLMQWGFIKDIEETVRIQGMKELQKTDGKKSTSVNIPKAVDANKAGSVKSMDCTLFITEGLSAKTFAVKGISAIEGGTNWYGVLPVRGKVLNVRGAKPDQINNNAEITALKQMLGLKHGTDYSVDEEFRKLRYGRVVFLVDADPDGDHIKGLLTNYFQYFYPTLVDRDYFIEGLRTPIVKATQGKKVLIFFYLKEFKDWAKKQKSPYKLHYYKGLGTSEDEEIIEIFQNPLYSRYISDDLASENVDKLFSPRRADERKKWLSEYSPKEFKYTVQDGKEIVPISDFINNEMIEFSLYDNDRSIPSVVDGLKPSQRKVMYVALKVLNQSTKYKVAQFASEVAKQAEYHHGEKSLEEAIVGLAQTFLGSNNIAMLHEAGQFGCVDPNTDVLLWDGSIKKARNVCVGDKLIGDDGCPRNVSKIVSGTDTMFKVKQIGAKDYIINSEHILTLRYSGHKSIRWKESAGSWTMSYYDPELKKIKYKTIKTRDAIGKTVDHFNKSKLSKEQAYQEMLTFSRTIVDENIFDISIKDYLNFSDEAKHHFKGIINSSNINWSSTSVPIDPYIFGMWLGDGNFCGRGFASADAELVKAWCEWAPTIGAEVVHYRNGDDHENYQYGIRRIGSGTLPAVGSKNHSIDTCIGCQTSKKSHPACDWKNTKISYNICNYSKGKTNRGHNRTDLNPFKQILKKHNLYKNKHIPECYIKNDRNVRLQVLAGFIDTDGRLKYQNNAAAFEITQSVAHHENLIHEIRYLAQSLGYRTSIYKSCDSNKPAMITVSIRGDRLDEIPTRLPRKKFTINKQTRNSYSTKLTIEECGTGPYCGWHIDGNERFLLGDFTITHNTRLEGGNDAAAGRYIFTHLSSIARYILRKEDDPILEYLEEDGKQIEPKYFVPVVPMLLVNGANGIGTGYSTNVPAFNPLEIVEWIRCWLKGDDNYPELAPWYRGFKGTTKKDGNKYVHYGVVNKEKDYYRITELPVGIWTDTYKDCLDSLKSGIVKAKTGYDAMTVAQLKEECSERGLPVGGTKKVIVDRLKKWDKENGAKMKKIGGGGQIVTKWEWYGDAYNVDFKVWTKPGVEIDPNDTKFKLCKTEGLTNMTAFNPVGGITKYDTLNDILETFCTVRLEYYQKRKKHLLHVLEEKLKQEKSKARFIAEALEDFDILKQTEDELFEHFEENGYYKKDGVFSYLTGMPIRTFNSDKYDELLVSIDKIKNEIDYVKKKSAKQMWTLELKEFVDAYKSWTGGIQKLHDKLAKMKIKKHGKK